MDIYVLLCEQLSPVSAVFLAIENKGRVIAVPITPRFKRAGLLSLMLATSFMTAACGGETSAGGLAKMNEEPKPTSTSSVLTSTEEPSFSAEPSSVPSLQPTVSADTAKWSPNSVPFPDGNWLAEIPESQVVLYSGEKEGVILAVGDSRRVFNWNYMTPRLVMPQMQIADFDGNGTDELMVILCMGSGTGVSVYELHIVDIYKEALSAGGPAEIRKPEEFRDNIFKGYEALLDQAVDFTSYTKDGQLRGDVTVAGKTSTVSLMEFQGDDSGKLDERPAFGSIVNFEAEGSRITAKFGLGVTAERHVSPAYVGMVLADVNYADGNFTMAHFHFEPDELYSLPE